MASFAIAGLGSNVTPKKLRRGTKITIAVLLSVTVLFAFYAYLCYLGTSPAIREKVSINGVNIEGMTKEQASEAVYAQFVSEYSDSEYTVSINGKEYSINVFSSLAIDPSAEIEEAYRLGHGEWITRGIEYLQSEYRQNETKRLTVTPYISGTDDILKAARDIAAEVYIAPVRGSWEYEDGTLSVTTGIHGESVKAASIYETIIDGLNNGEYSGSFEVPLAITEGKNVVIEPVVRSLYTAPVNASYQKQGKEILVVPSQEGSQILQSDIDTLLKGASEGTTVKVHDSAVAPEITTEQLQALLFADKITGYTVGAGYSWSQLNNQGLAVEAINGTVLMPGEVFSFNEIVGDTTPDKGYVEDYAYESGRLITQYGGGVCRVASTLYGAVLNSSLEVVMRYNHSSPVGYIPLGMDATVSYSLPDLQFKNNRDYPIQINMSLYDGYLHASITGTHIEGEPTVEAYVEQISDMKYVTYRNYYNDQWELLDQQYMHTSVYKPLTRE